MVLLQINLTIFTLNLFFEGHFNFKIKKTLPYYHAYTNELHPNGIMYPNGMLVIGNAMIYSHFLLHNSNIFYCYFDTWLQISSSKYSITTIVIAHFKHNEGPIKCTMDMVVVAKWNFQTLNCGTKHNFNPQKSTILCCYVRYLMALSTHKFKE